MKDQPPADPLDYLLDFRLSDAPDHVVAHARLLVLDLLGVGAGGSRTKLAGIICDHAAEEFGGVQALLFSDRTASASGSAMAAGMMIDSLDGHDGYNPAKGHVGCALIAGILALAPEDCSGKTFLEAVILGYELGSRLSLSLHGTVPDYHTSGAWMAVCVAGIGARLQGLSRDQAAHAMGIAEYHGPRSQMMRCIDTPTMVKDGSGWGAMAGVSAVKLAAKGFTGAPAITLSGPEAAPYFADLGARWLTYEQYIKPYPVCRWAHAPVEAALELMRAHDLSARDVTRIEVESFHEATRLAVNDPKTTEEAQYSTSYPVAIAIVRGGIAAEDLSEDALQDPEILRLSEAMTMSEHDNANAAFPETRLARVRLHLTDRREMQSEWTQPKWDADAPPTAQEFREKFDGLAVPVLGANRAGAIADVIAQMPKRPLSDLRKLVYGAP